MSRTFRKGEKGPGYEYWSKRPGNKKSRDPGKFAKKLNNRLERIEGKSESRYCKVCDNVTENCVCSAEGDW